jgi:hypothetical protein
MDRLLSRTAFIWAISYAVLVSVLLIAVWHVSDLEGRSFDLLFIGLPWIVVFHRDSPMLYFFTLVLNAATVYVLVLSVVRIFTSDSN